MKRLLAIVLATALLTTLGLACTAPPPAPAQVVEWKLISGPDRTDGHVSNYTLPLIEEINKQLAGRLHITYGGGPESVPPFAQLTPLRQGVYQMVATTPSFYAGDLPIAQVGVLLIQPTADIRAAGIYDLLDEIHQTKVNAKLLSPFSSGVGSSIFFKKKLGKADFSGLKIRTSPVYDPFVKTLGGATVNLPIGDVYGALDKGIVDGAAFPALGPLAFKWQEVSKFMIRPLFGASPQYILVNLDSWKALSPDLQASLQKIVISFEDIRRPVMLKLIETETAQLVNGGMTIDELPDAEASKLLKTFKDASWKGLVLDVDSVNGPKLKAMADKLP